MQVEVGGGAGGVGGAAVAGIGVVEKDELGEAVRDLFIQFIEQFSETHTHFPPSHFSHFLLLFFLLFFSFPRFLKFSHC